MHTRCVVTHCEDTTETKARGAFRFTDDPSPLPTLLANWDGDTILALGITRDPAARDTRANLIAIAIFNGLELYFTIYFNPN